MPETITASQEASATYAGVEAVLADVADLLPPEPVGDAWRFVPSSAALRRVPEDFDQFASTLRSRHTDEALVATSVFQRTEAGELVLHDRLARPGERVLLVHDLQTGQPVEFLSEAGSLSGEHAILNAWQRKEAVKLKAHRDRVQLVAFSVDDVALLRDLGLPATSAVGFEDLDLDQAEALARNFGISPCFQPTYGLSVTLEKSYVSDPMPPAEERPPRLLLVTWRPAALCLDLPDGFRALRQRLSEFAQFLKWDLTDVLVWQPNAEDIEGFQFFADHQEKHRLRTALIESMARRLQNLKAFDQSLQPSPPVPDLAAAMATWKAAIRENPQRIHAEQYRHEAWDELQAAIEGNITGPLIDEARASSSGSKRAQLLMAGGLAKRLVEQGLLLEAEVDARLRDFDPSIHGAGLPQTGLDQWLKLGHELAQIAERLEASESPSPGKIEWKQIAPRRLPDSSNLD
jgi:hypothetical protein